MTQERKIMAWVAVVGSVVACFPTACCLAFYGFGGIVALLADPRMIEAAAGSGEPPSRSLFTAMGVGSTLGALVALAIGIVALVWGIRALRRASAEKAEVMEGSS